MGTIYRDAKIGHINEFTTCNINTVVKLLSGESFYVWVQQTAAIDLYMSGVSYPSFLLPYY